MQQIFADGHAQTKGGCQRHRITKPIACGIVLCPSNSSFANHSGELVKVALSDAEEAPVALSILCTVAVDRPVMLECLTDSSFTREASALVSSGDIPDLTLSKLAQLTRAAFLTSPQESFRSCWFLSSLLGYVSNPSVFELFETLVSENKELEQVHGWLVRYGFVKDLLQLIKDSSELQVTDGDIYGNDGILRLANCYRLVESSARNPVLKPVVKTRETMSALFVSVVNAPAFLEGARLRALRVVMSRQWLSEVQMAVEHALTVIEMVTGPSQEAVESVRIITRAADLSNEVSQFLLTTQVLDVMVAMIVRNSEASILHAAFRVFVVHASKNEVMCQRVLERYLPFMINEARLRLHGQVAATCWFILNYLFVEQESNSMIRTVLAGNAVFKDMAETELKLYRKRLLTQYGGVLPKSIVRKVVPDAY